MIRLALAEHYKTVMLAIRARHDESYRDRISPKNWTVDGGCWCQDCHQIRIALFPELTEKQSKLMQADWDREVGDHLNELAEEWASGSSNREGDPS